MQNIIEKKTKINFYSLESFEYGENKNELKSFTLYDLKISSKEVNFKFDNDSKSFSLNFPIFYEDLIKLIDPLKEEIKFIEKNKQKKKIHNIEYFPNSHWKTFVYFKFNIDDIIKLFHITDFKNFFNQKLYCDLFFYLKKFDYYGEISNRFITNKRFYLFIFKNFNDEFDNLKFNSLVIKVKINCLNLEKILSFYLLKDKWFLNHKIYSKNKNIIIPTTSISEFLIKNSIEYNCIWILLNLVSFRVITYYGLLNMILNNNIKEFLLKYEKFCFILKNICLDAFKENIQDYKMNSNELFNYINDNFKKSFKIIISKNEIKNLIINNITCFIPFPTKELLYLNYLDSLHKINIKKDIVNLKFRGYIENDSFLIKDKLTVAYIMRILKIGINNIYQFFGYSESQFYNLSCYFIRNTNNIQLNKIILKKSGKLLDYKKQFFILFNPIIEQIPNEEIIKNDTIIKKETQESSNLNCDKISIRLYNKIIDKINRKTSYIIGLCNGYFGIWSYINDYKENIYIGPSNFNHPQNNLFIYDISKPRRILLNYRFLNFLLKFIDNGKIFIKIFENQINELNYFFSFLTSDNDCIEQLIKFYSKIRIYKDQFIFRLHESLYNLNKNILRDEGILYIKDSFILRGIFNNNERDKKLRPGYIYVEISPNNKTNDSNNYILKGEGLLFKYPNNYRVQKIKFSRSYKANLVNVIIFSSQEKDIFNNLNIQDLSIEHFLLIWDKRIVNNCNLAKLTTIENNNKKYNNENNKNVTFDEIYSDFCLSNEIKKKSMVINPKYDSIIKQLNQKVTKYLNDLYLKLKLFNEENINNNLLLDYKSLIQGLINKNNNNLSKEQFFFIKKIIILIPLLVDFIDSLYKLLLKNNINNLEYLLVSNFDAKLFNNNFFNQPNNFNNDLQRIINKLIENIKPDTTIENKNNYHNENFINSCICYNLFYNYEIIELIINSNKNIIENILDNEEDVNIKYNDFEYEIQSLGFDLINYYNNLELIKYETIFSNNIKKTFFENLLLLKSYIKDERICSIPYLIFYKYIFLLKNN